jgi:hypothetical protein
MNALFGAGIKGFLTLLQAENALRQDHGDGAHGAGGRVVARVVFGGHEGLYRPCPRFVSAALHVRLESIQRGLTPAYCAEIR